MPWTSRAHVRDEGERFSEWVAPIPHHTIHTIHTIKDGVLTDLAYLKQNMSLAKSSLPGATHGDVMRALSRQWTSNGLEADHRAFWRSAATAPTVLS
jgi:hypothetical protein